MKEPLKFVAWNVNSLLLRVKNNWPEFSKFVSDIDPDVIAIQEVRMPVAGSKGAPKNPREIKDDTSSSHEEKQFTIWKLSCLVVPCGLKVCRNCIVSKVVFSTIKAMKRYVIHPEFFSAAKLNGYVPPNKEDCGQPGFTLSEGKRYGAILKEGKLIDAYRFLHKERDMDSGFAWSGHPIGKDPGKRMRIDYFIVSEKLKDRIIKCEMHGQGIELEGFYWSDHCPVSLELSPASPDSNES